MTKPPTLLHPTLGVNVRLMRCRRCGAETGVALLGIKNWRAKCRHCGTTVFGLGQSVAGGSTLGDPCPRCEEQAGYVDGEQLLEGEPLPDNEPCETCSKELAAWREIVAAGGVYWKCPEGHQGVMRANEFAAEVRERANIPAPNPCGVAFTKEECPQCNPAAWREPGRENEGGEIDAQCQARRVPE